MPAPVDFLLFQIVGWKNLINEIWVTWEPPSLLSRGHGSRGSPSCNVCASTSPYVSCCYPSVEARAWILSQIWSCRSGEISSYVMTPWDQKGNCRRFGRMYCIHLQDWIGFLWPGAWGGMFLRNVTERLCDRTLSQLNRDVWTAVCWKTFRNSDKKIHRKATSVLLPVLTHTRFHVSRKSVCLIGVDTR